MTEDRQTLFRQEVINNRFRKKIIANAYRQQWTYATLIFGFAALLLVIATFFFFAKFKTTESARGVIVSKVQSQYVTITKPGIVSEVLVTNGQHVEKGDSIAILNFGLDSDQNNQVRALRSHYHAEVMRLEQLIHELEKSSNSFRLLHAESKELERLLTQYNEKIDELAQEGRDSVLLRIFLESEVMRLGREKRMFNAEQEQQEKDLQYKLFDLEQQKSSISAELSKLSQDKWHIAAPIAGRISNLQIGLKGQWVTTGSRIAAIAPKSDVEIQLSLTSKSIGSVNPGQEILIVIEAFPAAEFGFFKGEIVQVDPPIFVSSQNNPIGREAIFNVRARFLENELVTSGRVHPGMLLYSEIVIGEATLFERLLVPIHKVWGKFSFDSE